MTSLRLDVVERVDDQRAQLLAIHALFSLIIKIHFSSVRVTTTCNNDIPDAVRHQESRIFSGRHQFADFRRCYLELGHRMMINTPVRLPVQILNVVCAVHGQQFTQVPRARQLPTGTMRDNNVGQVE